MDIQFYGANCLSFNHKTARITIDDTVAAIGGKSITKADDVALFTSRQKQVPTARLVFDGPGEYEVGDISVIGIAARAHMDEPGTQSATMYKLVTSDTAILITGHIYPNLSEAQLEQVGLIDILIVPIGGNGYTVDPIGAQKLIKAIEPKIVVPTHYADKALNFEVPQQELATALKEMSFEPKETVSKLRFKPGESSDSTQLVVLEKS